MPDCRSEWPVRSISSRYSGTVRRLLKAGVNSPPPREVSRMVAGRSRSPRLIGRGRRISMISRRSRADENSMFFAPTTESFSRRGSLRLGSRFSHASRSRQAMTCQITQQSSGSRMIITICHVTSGQIGVTGNTTPSEGGGGGGGEGLRSSSSGSIVTGRGLRMISVSILSRSSRGSMSLDAGKCRG